MDFAEFHAGLRVAGGEGPRQQADARRFRRRHHDAHQPGGLGTVASVPRLMPGQGSIIAVGAIAYPARVRDVSDDKLARAGHRQGHDDHQHLRPPRHPGRRVGRVPRARWTRSSRARSAFYEDVFAEPGPRDGELPRGRRPPPQRPSRGPVPVLESPRPTLYPRGRRDGAGEGVPDPRPPRGAPRSARQRADRRSGARPRPARAHARRHGARSPPPCCASRCPGETLAEALPAAAGDLLRHAWPTRWSTSPTTGSGSGSAQMIESGAPPAAARREEQQAAATSG